MGEQFKQMLRENPDIVEMIKQHPAYRRRQIMKADFKERIMKYAEKSKSRASQITNVTQ